MPSEYLSKSSSEISLGVWEAATSSIRFCSSTCEAPAESHALGRLEFAIFGLLGRFRNMPRQPIFGVGSLHQPVDLLAIRGQFAILPPTSKIITLRFVII
jgi:hypothetical protein